MKRRTKKLKVYNGINPEVYLNPTEENRKNFYWMLFRKSSIETLAENNKHIGVILNPETGCEEEIIFDNPAEVVI